MFGRVIRLPIDDHREVQSVLPWYVTGRLEAEERDRVEAHLANCQECQADYEFERGLEARWSEPPANVERGWATMKARLNPAVRRPPMLADALGSAKERLRNMLDSWRDAGPWLGVAVVSPVLLVLFLAVFLRPPEPAGAYHVLGAQPVKDAGNLVVIFKPETPENRLRAALRANRARLVDGPTAADAYILSVPVAERNAVLFRLRASADVVLAEAIDSGERP